MTLITYPTRMHFADDILQEALQSELEQSKCSVPWLIHDQGLLDSEFEDRILEGLPRNADPMSVTFEARDDLRAIAKTSIATLAAPDVIIAFGSARAIELSRKCRYGLTQANKSRPLLYAVPGVDGLPGPCTKNLESWRAGLPSVLICDPTLTLGADQDQFWRSTVLSLVRCVESYLATAYNPPADGMALDGVGRCVNSLPRIKAHADLDLQREVMAAGLNAALSQEKGVGPTLTLAAALKGINRQLDEPELARLILPGTIRTDLVDAHKAKMLLNVVGKPESTLDAALKRLLGPAPMASCLSDLGVEAASLDVVASHVAGKAGLDFGAARSVLEAVY